MMEDRTQSDLEALSAFLDGELTEKQRSRLEARLLQDHGLQTDLERMRRTRALLRSTPQVIRKRSFTLTPEMVAAHKPEPNLFPAVSLVSALATILFVIVVGGDLASNLLFPGNAVDGAEDSLAAASEMMPVDAAAEEPAMAAEAAEAAEAPVEQAQLAEPVIGETDESAEADLAETGPALEGTPLPPLAVPQQMETPDYMLTPGIGGGAPEEPAPEMTPGMGGGLPEGTGITTTPEIIITPTPTEQETERAVAPDQEPELISPKVDEAEVEVAPDADGSNLLNLFLRLAEALLGVAALGTGIWAWRLRKG